MTASSATPSARSRLASDSVCAATPAKWPSVCRINPATRVYPVADLSDNRALSSTMGTPLAAACVRIFGQISVSTSAPKVGCQCSRKRLTAPGVSNGAQHHSTQPPNFCCTCSAPVGVVDVTSTLRSGRSASSRSNRGAIAKVSPTDTAWIHTRSPERDARCRP